MRGKGIPWLNGHEGSLALGAEAEDNAERHWVFIGSVGSNDCIGAESLVFQFLDVFSNERSKVDAEVREREVGNGNAAAQVFEIDDGVLELQELLAAILQVVHL